MISEYKTTPGYFERCDRYLRAKAIKLVILRKFTLLNFLSYFCYELDVIFVYSLPAWPDRKEAEMIIYINIIPPLSGIPRIKNTI